MNKLKKALLKKTNFLLGSAIAFLGIGFTGCNTETPVPEYGVPVEIDTLVYTMYGIPTANPDSIKQNQ